MQGNAEIIEELNHLLTAELTAMDVYFIQSRMCENWGYTKLSERWAHEMTDETRHAGALIKRILLLEGSPNLAARAEYSVGKTVEEMLKADLELERDVARSLNEVIAKCDAAGDSGSRMLLDTMLEDTEHDHIVWLEAQLRQLADMGVQGYLQAQL